MLTRRSVLAASAAIVGMSAAARAQAPRVIVGTGVDPSFSPLFYGVESGHFRQRGLDVAIQSFASGSAAVPSLIPGDINLAMTGPAAPILAHLRAPKVVLIAQFCTQEGYAELIGARSIAHVRDLRGKRVGFEVGTTTEVFAAEILARFQMTTADVQAVNLQPPEALAALQRNNIDAVFTFKPWSDRAVEAMGDRLHRIPGGEGFQSHLHVYGDRDWGMRNLDTLTRLLGAMKEAGEFINANRDQAAPVIGRNLRMEATVVRPLLNLNTYTMRFDNESVRILRREVELQQRTGRAPTPFPYEAFVWTEPLRRLDPALAQFTLS